VSDARPGIRLSSIVSQRLRRRGFVEPRDGLDAVSAWLERACGLTPAAAQALAWGEEAALTWKQVDRIAGALALDRDLLALVVGRSSPELVRETIRRSVESKLDPEVCAACAAYEQAAQGALAAGDDDALLALAYDLLAHINEQDAGDDLIGDVSELDELVAGPAPFAPPADVASLPHIVSSLPKPARLRVLAAALNEQAAHLENSERKRLDIVPYRRLRSDTLSPLARAALDALAASPEGTLTAGELVDALGLSDARPLGQLRRSIESSLRHLANAGVEPPPHPLLVSRTASGLRYRLDDRALAAWRELLREQRSLATRPDQ